MSTGSEVPRHLSMTQTAVDGVAERPVGERDKGLMEPPPAALTGLAQRPKQGSMRTLAAALTLTLPSQTYQIPGSQDQLRDPGRGGTSGRLQVKVITFSVTNASHLEISNSKVRIHRDSLLDYPSPHKPEYGLPEPLWLASL